MADPTPIVPADPAAGIHPNVLMGFAQSLLVAMEMRNPELAAHARRVGHWCRELAKLLGELPSHEILEIEVAGLLHDVGFVICPIRGRNSFSECEPASNVYPHHTILGHQMLSRIPGFQSIADAVLHHHEAVDGSGFPHKLWREKIPMYARVVAVVDQYDGELFSEGSAHDASMQRARKLLVMQKGKTLDPHLTNLFLYQFTVQEPAMIQQNTREVLISPLALMPDMVLSRDLVSIDNILLLKKGVRLTSDIIDRLMSSPKAEWMGCQVYVDADSIRAAPVRAAEDKPRVPVPDTTVDKAAAGQHTANILVVDDSKAVCNALRRELGRAGVSVDWVTDPEGAVDRLGRYAYDALITDLVLADASGFDLLRLIQQNHPGLHCVVLSGYPTPANIRALQEFNNVVRFVTKPWSPPVLLEAVNDAVARTKGSAQAAG